MFNVPCWMFDVRLPSPFPTFPPGHFHFGCGQLPLYTGETLCHAAAVFMVKKLLPLLLLPLLFAGCSTITNLTPAQMPRNASGLYLVEAAWDTREQALRPGTLEPKVMIGESFIPM